MDVNGKDARRAQRFLRNAEQGSKRPAQSGEGRKRRKHEHVKSGAPARSASGERGHASSCEGDSDQGQVYDFRRPGKRGKANKPVWEVDRPVFFVGFMGAGKTSTARKLARSARVTAIDMDTYIERRCDKKVKEIFAESGEEGFRAIETAILEELASGEPCLVSCGGGVVLAERNREILKEKGFVVYLKVTAAEAASRISDVSTRPLFGDLEQAERVIAGRLPLYEEVADITLDTAGRGTASIAHEAFNRLVQRGVLKKSGA